MPFQVIPRERSFFDLFEEQSRVVAEAARELRILITNSEKRDSRAERVRALEHEGDELTHRVMATLNTTFVTPFDREDIYRLASQLDDVLDGQEAVADLLSLHKIEEPLIELRQLADILVQVTDSMQEAVRGLRTLGEQDHLIEINRLENEGDRVYRKTIARLFSGEFRAMDVLKWKDVVDEMERALDACEDIANTIESIALKHA